MISKRRLLLGVDIDDGEGDVAEERLLGEPDEDVRG